MKERNVTLPYFYLHIFPKRYEGTEKGFTRLQSLKACTQAKNLDDLFYRLQYRYGTFDGFLINKQTRKTKGWIFIKEDIHTEIEILSQPMTITHTMMHPYFLGEEKGHQALYSQTVEEQYPTVVYPFPEKVQLRHKQHKK